MDSDNRYTPTPGETWRHYKGGLYQIIMWYVDEESGQPAILYKPTKGSGVYGRLMDKFMGRNEAGEYRFEKV